MNRPIEDYGLIADGATAALVARDGSIDWLCLPRFDSDACFAALLGDERHGFWKIAPSFAGWRMRRAYRPGTLVLDTEFERGGNVVRLTDFMPRRGSVPALIRIVTGLSGQAEMRLDLRARFDYGLLPPWQEQPDERTVRCLAGPDQLVLHAPVPLRMGEDEISADFTVGKGEGLAFVLTHAGSAQPMPKPPDASRALAQTEAFWRDWIGRFSHETHWPEATARSLLTLKALVYHETGAMLAAPTTSLPEIFGGENNFDYRFCWLRDATFTIGSLLNAGYHEEAIAWRDWMLRSIASDPAKLRIMYRVDGGRHMFDWKVKWLPGYADSRPVNVGNPAADQEQLDVPGELIDALSLMRRAGLPESEHARTIERRLVEQIERTWQDRGHGLWESRKEPRHYVYSKVMVWAGLDRFLRDAAVRGLADEPMIARLQDLRARVHDEVCTRGFNRSRGHFVHEYGGSDLDGSLLLMAPVGFLPANDERVANTIEAISRELTEDGFVLRKPRKEAPEEGAFLPCTCWLADCRAMQGRDAEARELLERVLAVRNDLGLISEEYDTRRKRLCGNFPQALTHLAMLNSALGLSGPVLQRAGG